MSAFRREIKHETEIISITPSIDFVIGYDGTYAIYPPQKIEFHGLHEIDENELIEVNLTSVEVIVFGESIDILPFLNGAQRDAIIDELSIL